MGKFSHSSPMHCLLFHAFCDMKISRRTSLFFPLFLGGKYQLELCDQWVIHLAQDQGNCHLKTFHSAIILQLRSLMVQMDDWRKLPVWALIYLFILKFIFYWTIVDLQCCVSFRCMAKWFICMYTYTFIRFQILFPCKLSQNIEQSSLCYTVGPCWLSILCIVVCICQSQSPNLSLPPPFTFGDRNELSSTGRFLWHECLLRLLSTFHGPVPSPRSNV